MRDLSIRLASALTVVALGATAVSQQLLPAPTAQQIALTTAFAAQFGVSVPRPAVFNASGCPTPHLTGTAYLRASSTESRLLTIYTTPDGQTVTRATDFTARTPAGEFRMLVAIIGHPQTIGPTFLTGWAIAQQQINALHASFAASRGFPAPIVTFEHTNVVLPPAEVSNPRTLAGITPALMARGISPTDYDFVTSLNIDPTQPEGGFAAGGGFIYMGNYGNWQQEITVQAVIQNIAASVYSHEVGHHWGWPGTHDWACDTIAPFIVPAVLYGWEDLDGDGLPEILDPTPYGRASSTFVQNGTFNGSGGWLQFALPDASYMVSSIENGVFQFARLAAPPGQAGQATVFQQTGQALPAGAPLLAEFDIGNSSTARKRLTVLLVDHDFSDLQVCTFWLAPGAPLRTYRMRTVTRKAWSDAAIYFYAATPGQDGGHYLLTNVSMRWMPEQAEDRTDCVDPTAPSPPGGSDSPSLLINGDFAGAGLAPWALFGDITGQLAGGVFEFIRPGTPGQPAGVVLQGSGSPIGANRILTTTLDLGNSSGVWKRVTLLVHDGDFSDLAACTFWLAPGQALTPYTMRSITTEIWSNATVSLYAGTIGSESWTRLDNVSLRATPTSVALGTECIRN